MRWSEWLNPVLPRMHSLSSRRRCYTTASTNTLLQKRGTQNNCELFLSPVPKRADYGRIRGFTMKNIPDTDTISRLSLSEKGWNGSGLPEMGLTLSTLEYLASNWGRSSSWFTTHIPVWTIELSDWCSNNSPLYYHVSGVQISKDAMQEYRPQLRGNHMIWGLFDDIADAPLPLPNQWDPSRKSALPSFFSRTPGIPWL